ncbi:dynamin-like 120 kDa protein, mitochondrial isoform X2 [Corticium candelabrum]|uniref:dynamin-like 120 kDa protein, mitochondrial isoform X2 n=1 Tax=Corticium candelabrum TaxID=121492 RepID=UPI002E26F3A9|nr:dynamin-like 120 kDa protein, mitochondrial isoform X2 [Corticium candelabrum]
MAILELGTRTYTSCIRHRLVRSASHRVQTMGIGKRLFRFIGRRFIFVSVVSATVVSGVYVVQKYRTVKESLPNLSWVFDATRIAKDGLGNAKEMLVKFSDKLNFSRKHGKQEEALSASDTVAAAPAKSFTGKTSSFREEELTERLQQAQNNLLEMQQNYQKELERLEKENKDLRQRVLLTEHGDDTGNLQNTKKSLIDMYSEILDILGEQDSNYVQDHLPRVVVVGDQSSGKTSVLEMIAQARIFPRGGGEMMTRAPVKVTMSEGPQHVAQIKGNYKMYDLTRESDLQALRKEIELLMLKSVEGGKTVSSEVISLTVRGPGLNRVVLVDLPGIISTETSGMAAHTKEAILDMCRQQMSNPNAIILCIQDGSVDAERSNVTELVGKMDPLGKRTILVLTKVDLAERNEINPNRIKSILDGKLFPIKALGHFAVVTGSGNSSDGIDKIRDYEESFFKSSNLFRSGVLQASQLTTRSLSFAVSRLFWDVVKESIQQQAQNFRAIRYNLETEWKNTFPKQRELDRNELFEKGKEEILDQITNLCLISPQEWEDSFTSLLTQSISAHLVNNIYIPAATRAISQGHFKTQIDIKLREWAEGHLPTLSLKVGLQALMHEFEKIVKENAAQNALGKVSQGLFDPLCEEVVRETKYRHVWETGDKEKLRVIQVNTLEDQTVQERWQWESAVRYMKRVLEAEQHLAQQAVSDLVGPGSFEKWLYWKSQSPEQMKRAVTREELLSLTRTDEECSAVLSTDEITAVRKNLQAKKTSVTDEFIVETWSHVYREQFLANSLRTAEECRRAFYHRHLAPVTSKLNCDDVVLFWRIQRMIQATSNALRQQIMNSEARRLEKEVKQLLETMALDKSKKHQLINGKRVDLAEKLKRVRSIQDKLFAFIDALSNEK